MVFHLRGDEERFFAGMKVVTNHVSNGKQDGIREIKFPVYGKRQITVTRQPCFT